MPREEEPLFVFFSFTYVIPVCFTNTYNFIISHTHQFIIYIYIYLFIYIYYIVVLYNKLVFMTDNKVVCLCLYYRIILLHCFGFSTNVKRFMDTLYTQLVRTVQIWHCSRITACIGIRTGVLTLRGLRKYAVRDTVCCQTHSMLPP
jgi:hypothetical protein